MTPWQRLLASIAGLCALGAAATVLPQFQCAGVCRGAFGIAGALSPLSSCQLSYWVDGALAGARRSVMSTLAA